MSWRSVPHKHTFWLALFFGLLFFQGLFLAPQSVLADSWAGTSEGRETVPTPTSAPVDNPPSGNTNNQAPAGGGAENASGKCSWYNFALSPVDCLLIPAIDGLKLGVSWFAAAAAGLFIWVVDPASISGPTGILNKAEVYNLWKFIRDFFNLFFILILLLSAFATIFQVENFSIRRIFLNILFAALIINFSFPITRLLIDLTNVPMYYFLNAINLPGGGVAEAHGGKAFADQFLGSSGMGGIALQKSASLGQAFFGFVFMFLFTISLLVLGVLMLIRLIALTLLLIFSPIGFAASLLPGMSDLGHKWWGKFWQYAFFGPAAALVLLVAIRFQNEVGFDGTYASIRTNINNLTGSSAESSALSMLVFYLIPIILIWTAIGMANAFSIAGASKVTGWGETAARWTGRKAGKLGIGGMKLVGKAVLPTNIAKGVAAGAKEGLKGGKLFGKQIIPKALSPKMFKERAEDREAKWKGRLKEGTGQNELDKLKSKRQYEAAKEMKENNVSYSALIDALKGTDKTKAGAAAMVLTDKKAINSAEHLDLAFRALGENSNELAELINNAGDEAFKFDTSTTRGADSFGELRKKLADLDTRNGSKLNGKLEDKIKKEGHSKVLIDYEINNSAAMAAGPVPRQPVYDRYLAKMTAKEIAKMQDVHAGPDPEVLAYVRAQLALVPGATPGTSTSNWGAKDMNDFYSELTSAQKAAWRAQGVHP